MITIFLTDVILPALRRSSRFGATSGDLAAALAHGDLLRGWATSRPSCEKKTPLASP